MQATAEAPGGAVAGIQQLGAFHGPAPQQVASADGEAGICRARVRAEAPAMGPPQRRLQHLPPPPAHTARG
jgi:hypothetical protein